MGTQLVSATPTVGAPERIHLDFPLPSSLKQVDGILYNHAFVRARFKSLSARRRMQPSFKSFDAPQSPALDVDRVSGTEGVRGLSVYCRRRMTSRKYTSDCVGL